MIAKKSVIKELDDQILQTYIDSKSRFTDKAKIIAYEVLVERNYNFTNEQISFINELKNNKNKLEIETKKVHPNYLIAARLISISLLLGILNSIFSNKVELIEEYIVIIFTVLFVLVIAYLVRKGINFMKYILLFLFIVGTFFSIPFLPLLIELKPIDGFVYIIQSILQLVAIIFLFLIPKKIKPNN